MEISTSRKGVHGVNKKDYDFQNETKESRLRKLNLIPLNSQLVLDAGCGPGTYGLVIAKQGNVVVGIDISLESLKLAKERAKSKGLELSFMPILADLDKLPIQECIFDVCFIGWALHHFPSLFSCTSPSGHMCHKNFLKTNINC